MRYIPTLLATSMLGCAVGTQAVTSYDQNVTQQVIFGSGNSNGKYTVDRSNGVELGLRGKLRHSPPAGAPANVFNSNGDGTYSFNAGVGPGQVFPTAEWSYEWSINSNFDGSSGWNLDDLTYLLQLDTDPSMGVDFSSFDPIHSSNPGKLDGHWDHSIGNNSTAAGAGVEAGNIGDYQTLLAGNNLAQNSWKAHWYISPFDPTVDGTYDFALSAFDSLGNKVAGTSIQIIVGAGGSPVPDGGSLAAMLGLSLLGFAAFRRSVQHAN